MVIIKKQNGSIIVSSKDSFNSLKECVELLIPNATKIKPSYIPFGNIGIYQLNNKVFKFSFVSNEAKACCRIMDGNFKNVVNVFSVHKIILNKKKYYLIEMEKLNKIKKVTFDYLDIQNLYENFDCKLNDLLEFITNLIKCYIGLKKTKILTKSNKDTLKSIPELEDILINIYEGFENINDTVYYIENLIKGCLELKSVGIVHKDLHSDNLLIDNKGVYKIIDFGVITLRRKF